MATTAVSSTSCSVGYINSAARHFDHYESGGEAVNIGAPIPSNLIIDKTSKASNIHSASKSSNLIGTVNSIRTRQMNSDSGVMARTKNSEHRRDGQRQDG